MARGHWLIKSEPAKYSFDQLVRDGLTRWDGVRNYEARNNLRAMKKGDLCLYYHSNEGKGVVGVARVAREAYADPTADPQKSGADWSAVDIEPVRRLGRPITLTEMRSQRGLGDMAMFARPRLSVVPVTPEDFKLVVELAASG